MDFGSIITFVTGHAELVLAVLGLASAVARVTPTEADNKVVDFIFGIIHTLGLTKPAPPPAE